MRDRILSIPRYDIRVEDAASTIEPPFAETRELWQEEDATLDAWLASFAPNEFEQFLESLARSDVALSAVS